MMQTSWYTELTNCIFLGKYESVSMDSVEEFLQEIQSHTHVAEGQLLLFLQVKTLS